MGITRARHPFNVHAVRGRLAVDICRYIEGFFVASNQGAQARLLNEDLPKCMSSR